MGSIAGVSKSWNSKTLVEKLASAGNTDSSSLHRRENRAYGHGCRSVRSCGGGTWESFLLIDSMFSVT